jgi:hypothetical protein
MNVKKIRQVIWIVVIALLGTGLLLGGFVVFNDQLLGTDDDIKRTTVVPDDVKIKVDQAMEPMRVTAASPENIATSFRLAVGNLNALEANDPAIDREPYYQLARIRACGSLDDRGCMQEAAKKLEPLSEEDWDKIYPIDQFFKDRAKQ